MNTYEQHCLEHDLQAKLAALEVRNAALLDALEGLEREFYSCSKCEGTGKEFNDPESACSLCGGYGFNPGGDIREARIHARAAIKEEIA